MAVFVAAADESEAGNQRGAFLFGGYVAPVRDWCDWFAPAWRQRVLRRPPAIALPYFHMAELASEKGRAKYGLSERDAETRIDEAVAVIASMGSLYLAYGQLDGGHFRDTFSDTELIQVRGKQRGVYRLDPDYVAFLAFAYCALEYVARHHVDAERVDFVVEKKSKVTHHIQEFHDELADSLRSTGHANLIHLIGDLVAGSKDLVALQAADLALWHLRRFTSDECTRTDERRLWKMGRDRIRAELALSREYIEGLAARSKENAVQRPAKPKRTPART